ncbi:hypothetical protein EPN42_05655 [bacterium]|nr:MAG: hypothetical protein EPN42_05655 [bacterium]
MKQDTAAAAAAPNYSTKKLHEAAMAALRESVIRETRIDPEQVLTKFGHDWGKIREAVNTKVLREAVAETSFAQLLRYGVQKELLNIYELTDVSYRQWALVVPSKGFENYYAPVFRAGLPSRVERGEAYPEVKLSGIEQTIRNYKWGDILGIEEELFEDDQTGQISIRAGELGENMAYVEEVWFYQQLLAANFTAIGNETSGGGALLLPMLQYAHQKFRKVKDGEGNIIVVRPEMLVVDTDEELVAKQLLKSIGIPQNPGASPAAGSAIYFGTINPLQDAYECCATPFLSQAAATSANPNGYGLDSATPPKFLVMKKRGMVFQDRTALKVTQEAPNSGDGFKTDTIRYKARRRFGAGDVDPRFQWRLN